ncbi:VOC family protein [Sphingobium lignivorans]|uniref:VOC domain-containing protein n=1 Tax=Sphingobium lignivorans TaxID=2735886 RepID=A0ABR6NK34_9SPHN|nr:hypothetical protein [Sphingobium lignivorans]
MSNRQGEFIWYELMTTDIAAARAFYAAVVGWTISESSDMPGMDYRMVAAPDGTVAGMMPLDAEMIAGGARSMWVGYIAVDDVDAAAARITATGGHVFVPPRDIPEVGRFAMAGDPQGATFYVMRGFPDQRSDAFRADAPGHCAWNELTTPDQPGAHAFYEGLFGWTSPDSMPMGELGDYRFLWAGDLRLGATMPGEGPAHWLFYFAVPSITRAMDAITAHGGTVTNGPHEVPGGGHIVTGTDPQGARFALFGSLEEADT